MSEKGLLKEILLKTRKPITLTKNYFSILFITDVYQQTILEILETYNIYGISLCISAFIKRNDKKELIHEMFYAIIINITKMINLSQGIQAMSICMVRRVVPSLKN